MKFLVLGISGQDGKILQILSKKYKIELFGITHRSNQINKNTYFWDGSGKLINSIISEVSPDVIVNLSAEHSSSQIKNQNYEKMYTTNTLNVLTILEEIKNNFLHILYVNSLSSHMYSEKNEILVNEETKLNPRNFYGLTKYHALNISEFYERQFGVKVLNLIMFNHESEFRKEEFLTKKISTFLKNAYKGNETVVSVNNAFKAEDFSDAYDFMEALIHLCKNNKTGRYVLSSNELNTIQDLILLTSKRLGIENISIKSNEKNKTPSIYGDNKKLLSTGFKFKSNIYESLYRMVQYSIKNE